MRVEMFFQMSTKTAIMFQGALFGTMIITGCCCDQKLDRKRDSDGYSLLMDYYKEAGSDVAKAHEFLKRYQRVIGDLISKIREIHGLEFFFEKIGESADDTALALYCLAGLRERGDPAEIREVAERYKGDMLASLRGHSQEAALLPIAERLTAPPYDPLNEKFGER
jgi:hypothetical protein